MCQWGDCHKDGDKILVNQRQPGGGGQIKGFCSFVHAALWCARQATYLTEAIEPLDELRALPDIERLKRGQF